MPSSVFNGTLAVLERLARPIVDHFHCVLKLSGYLSS
jgi:hypothetical protein